MASVAGLAGKQGMHEVAGWLKNRRGAPEFVSWGRSRLDPPREGLLPDRSHRVEGFPQPFRTRFQIIWKLKRKQVPVGVRRCGYHTHPLNRMRRH